MTSTFHLIDEANKKLATKLSSVLQEKGVNPDTVFKEDIECFLSSEMPSFLGIHTAALQRQYFMQNYGVLVSHIDAYILTLHLFVVSYSIEKDV